MRLNSAYFILLCLLIVSRKRAFSWVTLTRPVDWATGWFILSALVFIAMLLVGIAVFKVSFWKNWIWDNMLMDSFETANTR